MLRFAYLLKIDTYLWRHVFCGDKSVRETQAADVGRPTLQHTGKYIPCFHVFV